MAHTVWAPNGHLAQWVVDQFEPGYRGHALDVGASDGVSINTTFQLERSHHWTVVSVEPNPVFHEMLKRERLFVETCAVDSQPSEDAVLHVHLENPESFSSLRPRIPNNHKPEGKMTWAKTKVAVRTVDQILEKWQFPKLDLLSVDTEGTELDVLKGCNLERWRPPVVIVESWEKVGDADRYLSGMGYNLSGRNVDNNLYVKKWPAR